MARNVSIIHAAPQRRPFWRRTYSVVVSILSIVVTVLVSGARLSRPFEAADMGPTFGNGALEYRLQMVRDKFGRIPTEGLVDVKRHVEAMRRRIGTHAQLDATAISRSSWRWLGPANVGGRVRALAVHPTNPSMIFAGTAGGGIWRTVDAGVNWSPVDDFMPALSVSAIVIDPANPNTMYAGTGESYRNGDAILGAGVFKSTDGGATWAQLPATADDRDFQRFGGLAISPDGQVLLTASSYVIARSTDGGASFTKVTPPFVAIQVAFHPSRASEAVAAGYGGTAMYSKDAGRTWNLASGFSGVPSDARVELAWAASEPDTLYASVDYQGGRLFKSIDGGMSYVAVYTGTVGLTCCQGWYAQAIWVNPKDGNHVVVGGGQLSESFDGGLTWTSLAAANPGVHADQHAIAADPRFDNVNNRTVYFANDGGVYKADIRAVGPAPAQGFTSLNQTLGVTQFYGGAGNAATGVVIGGAQDNGTARYTPATGTAWANVQGGDNGYVASDATDPNVFYTTFSYLSPFRTVDGGTTWTDIGGNVKGQPARFMPPLVLDPNDARTLFLGGDRLYRTTNPRAASPSWLAVEPAPARADDYVSAIAVAPGDSNTIFVGHTYGGLFRTVNGTSATPGWTELAVPTQGLVSRVTISPVDRNVVYVTTGSFSTQNIWKSVDNGATWVSITGTGATAIPAVPVNDIEVDPNDAATLYAATDVGLFMSADGGASWQVPSVGPANTRIQELFWMGGSMVAVTYGRGMFAVDLGSAGGKPSPTAPTSLRLTSSSSGK